MTAAEILSLLDTFWPAEAEGAHLHTNPPEAVRACRVVASTFYEAMEDAGFSLQRGVCVLVCAEKSDKPRNIPFLACECPDSADAEITRFIQRHELEPIGIGFALAAPGEKKILMGGRGFENSERTDGLLRSVLE